MKILAPFLLSALALAGCAAPDFLLTPRAQAQRVAEAGGFTEATYRAGPFTLLAYERLTPGAAELAVYIESDGNAWLDEATLSADPTPIRPLVLRLAAQDPAPSRLYLARPCQYGLDRPGQPPCSPAFWSTDRFAPVVVAGYASAIDLAKRRSGATRVRIVGYSGGAAIAALLAARREDVESLVTAAGILDHEFWTRSEDLSPLTGSLNPADAAPALSRVRQTHFVGARDRVVPPAVADSYAARMRDRSRLTIVRLSGYDHECCWAEAWPALLARHLGADPARGR